MRQTFNLVQAIALASISVVKKNPRAYEAFWTRSQAVAQLAMLIADERIAVCNVFPDQAFLAGIFHDCGVPLLMQRFTTYCAEMHWANPAAGSSWPTRTRSSAPTTASSAISWRATGICRNSSATPSATTTT